MASTQLRLKYPLQYIAQPVVTELVRQFDVMPNVLAADVEAGKGGWMVLELTGDDERIRRAVSWIKRAGIEVSQP